MNKCMKAQKVKQDHEVPGPIENVDTRGTEQSASKIACTVYLFTCTSGVFTIINHTPHNLEAQHPLPSIRLMLHHFNTTQDCHPGRKPNAVHEDCCPSHHHLINHQSPQP